MAQPVRGYLETQAVGHTCTHVRVGSSTGRQHGRQHGRGMIVHGVNVDTSVVNSVRMVTSGCVRSTWHNRACMHWMARAQAKGTDPLQQSKAYWLATSGACF